MEMTRHPRKAKEPAAGEPKAKRVKFNAATTSSLVPAFVHTNGQAVVPAPVPDVTTISVGALQVTPNGGAQSAKTEHKAKEPITCGSISGVQFDTATTTGLSFVSENTVASASAPPNDISMGSSDVPGSSSTAIVGHDSVQAAEKPRRRKAKEPASGEPKTKRIKSDPATIQQGLSGTTESTQEASASSGAYCLLFSYHSQVDDEVVLVKKGRPKKEKDPANSTTTVKVPKQKRSKKAKENEAAMAAPKPKGMSFQMLQDDAPLWIIILQLFMFLRRTLRPGD